MEPQSSRHDLGFSLVNPRVRFFEFKGAILNWVFDNISANKCLKSTQNSPDHDYMFGFMTMIMTMCLDSFHLRKNSHSQLAPHLRPSSLFFFNLFFLSI